MKEESSETIKDKVFREKTKDILGVPSEARIEVGDVEEYNEKIHANVTVEPKDTLSHLDSWDMDREGVQSAIIRNPTELSFVVRWDELSNEHKEKLEEVL